LGSLLYGLRITEVELAVGFQAMWIGVKLCLVEYFTEGVVCVQFGEERKLACELGEVDFSSVDISVGVHIVFVVVTRLFG
jgi:hypothetical protein